MHASATGYRESRTYLKIVVLANVSSYNRVCAALKRRSIGTDSGAFSRGEHSRGSSWSQTRTHALGARSGAVDPEHGRAVAHAPAVLPELQDGSSALSALVRA